MPANDLTNSEASDKTTRWLEAVRARLLAARVALNKSIRAYPAPIPACDAQFNGLLDQRRQLNRAIRDIDGALVKGASETLTGVDLHKIADDLEQVDDTLAARLKATLAGDPHQTPTAR